MCVGGTKPKDPQPPPTQPPPPPVDTAAKVAIGVDEGPTPRRKVGRSQLRSQSVVGTTPSSGLGT